MFRYKDFRKEVGISQNDLATLLGCRQPNISAMERTNHDLEPEHERKLKEKFGDELINRFISLDSSIVYDSDSVPLIPVEAMAGTLQAFSEGVGSASCRKIMSPVKGAEWAIQISGDSMQPDYKNSSYLFIKKMAGSFIPWGQTMVIDTYDGVVVKEIYPFEDNEDYIEARSINPKYPPFQIEKSSIIGIYRVLVGHL